MDGGNAPPPRSSRMCWGAGFVGFVLIVVADGGSWLSWASLASLHRSEVCLEFLNATE